MGTWKRAVRFIADNGKEYYGEPEDEHVDIGLAISSGQHPRARLLNATSVFDETSSFSGEVKTIAKLLSPLTTTEVGTIRCIGLNYKDHAVSSIASLNACAYRR